MTGSKNRSAQARDALLDSAHKLIVEKGYSATSIDTICENAGYTKGTFFYYFENKQDVGKSLLMRQRERMSSLKNAPFMMAPDPLERMLAYIDFIVQLYRDPIADSCIVGILSEELASSHPEIRLLCKQVFSEWTGSLRDMLEEARQVYNFKSSIDLEDIAEHFVAVFEGAVILARAKASTDPIARNLKIYRDFIHNMIKPATKQ